MARSLQVSRPRDDIPQFLQRFWPRFTLASTLTSISLLGCVLAGLIPIYGIADWSGALILVAWWLVPLVWVFYYEVTQPGGFRQLTIGRLAFVALLFAVVALTLAPAVMYIAVNLYFIGARAVAGA